MSVLVTVFKYTSDEWYPTYSAGIAHKLVVVLFSQPWPDAEEWRVSAWGADDFGLARDFTDKDAAWECFLDIVRLEDVTVDAVKAMGFVST